jgi:hypothetical protein
MLSHDELIAKMLQNPQVRAEYERIEREEMPMQGAILSVRKQAKLALSAHLAKIRPRHGQAGAN